MDQKEKLFKIESLDSLFDYRFEACDIPMWAVIRSIVMRSLYNILFKREGRVPPYDEYTSQKKMFKYYLQSARKTPYTYRQTDILFLFSPTADILNIDNKFMNSVYGDYFLASKENSIIVQSSANYSYAIPSIDNGIRFLDMVNIFIEREKRTVSDKDLKSIEGLLSYLKENLPICLEEKLFSQAKNILLNTASRIIPMIKHYKRLFMSLAPKAAVFECAHYLGPHAIQVAVAREMGIKAVELQHGLVSGMHDAYNFGAAALKNDAFLKCLPDYFLLFGDYWGTLINTPAKRIPIGSPNFYKKESKYVFTPKNTVLILYNIPSEPDECLSNYAIELAHQLSDYTITYRFHPGIKKSAGIIKKLTADKDLKNLRIDKNTNIYDSLHENEYVIGEGSTVLYEAACLGKKVYSLETESGKNLIDPSLFTNFGTPGELLEKIKNKEGVIIDTKTKESIFGSGFPNTYLDFLSSIGI